MGLMRYRLALDLGSTSLGWAMVRLNANDEPCAVIKAGVRIFSDGRNPKDGSSLAVTRREARAMRRRRDRLLKRKTRMMRTLIVHGFFPEDIEERKALETLNPYELRAKGLGSAMSGSEFARALFHINQRRGFKSNRKTDKKDNDSGALKTAIKKLREALTAGNCTTVGQWLHLRQTNGHTVRARFRQNRVLKDDGKARIDKSYDLYIDRAMIEDEFEALWAKQSELNPVLFTPTARAELKDCLLHQRPLKPVKPGRCTFLPDEERAPLALPSTQRFRIYQEANNLRILVDGLKEQALTLAQRDSLVHALETGNKTFKTQIPKLIGVGGEAGFNLADAKRIDLKGNATSTILSKKDYFGSAWFSFNDMKQDAIVMQLVREENEATLIRWLQDETGVDEAHAEAIANAGLPEGYGSLSIQALARILPELRRDVVTYDKAVVAAGFDHHSNISTATTGEILPELPYYGEYLQRHVGFGTGNLSDPPEKRFGKIANPTVHIGLNQVRLVVNALIKRYGHPSEVIVELARDLKQSQEQRKEEQERQAKNQRRNERIRADVAHVLQISTERVKAADIQKVILWEELSFDPVYRQCPYSGVQISMEMLLSDQVEIEHILPFSETLDDSLNNKTVAMRQANRIKGNRMPWQAFGAVRIAGFEHTNNRPLLIVEIDRRTGIQAGKLLACALAHDHLAQARRELAPLDDLHIRTQSPDLGADSPDLDIGIGVARFLWQVGNHDKLRRGNRLAFRIAKDAGCLRNQGRMLASDTRTQFGRCAATQDNRGLGVAGARERFLQTVTHGQHCNEHANDAGDADHDDRRRADPLAEGRHTDPGNRGGLPSGLRERHPQQQQDQQAQQNLPRQHHPERD